MTDDDNELLEDWLKIAESPFDFWDNEDDDVYDNAHKYRVWESYWNHVMPRTVTITDAPSTASYFIALICNHCSGNHYSDKCPYIKAIEYHENGAIKRIEFYPRPGDFHQPIEINWGIGKGR